MTVYDFLALFNDLSSAVVTIFDLNSGEEVFRSEYMSSPSEVDWELQNYEVSSVDLFMEKCTMHLEINIDDEAEDD